MQEHPDFCPHCNSDLRGEDIFESFISHYRDEEKALKAADMYGWTKENPCRFSRAIGLYSINFDRTYAFQCPDCKKEIERTKHERRTKRVSQRNI